MGLFSRLSSLFDSDLVSAKETYKSFKRTSTNTFNLRNRLKKDFLVLAFLGAFSCFPLDTLDSLVGSTAAEGGALVPQKTMPSPESTASFPFFFRFFILPLA